VKLEKPMQKYSFLVNYKRKLRKKSEKVWLLEGKSVILHPLSCVTDGEGEVLPTMLR
jgi:hypothetical protein